MHRKQLIDFIICKVPVFMSCWKHSLVAIVVIQTSLLLCNVNYNYVFFGVGITLVG